MKTIMVAFAGSGNCRKGGNQYDSFRNEGRILINIGFGLSLLDYDVYIYNDCWKIDGLKEVWKNVHLCSTLSDKGYDIMLTNSMHYFNTVKFNRAVYMAYAPDSVLLVEQFIDSTKKDIKIAWVSKKTLSVAQSITHYKIDYLPAIYPVPSTNIGFLPFHYEPKLPELNVYFYSNSWGITEDDFLSKKRLINNFLNQRYKMNLWIHEYNEESAKKYPLSGDTINYVYNYKTYYDDLLDLIKSVDICVTQGGLCHVGGSIFDIIGLGKPVIYIAHGIPNVHHIHNINPLYDCIDNLILVQEPDDISLAKLEKIMSNPKESHECFRNAAKDMDFNNWKSFALKIFS